MISPSQVFLSTSPFLFSFHIGGLRTESTILSFIFSVCHFESSSALKTIDSFLSLKFRNKLFRKFCFLYFQNILKTWSIMTSTFKEGMVISHQDYCNSLLTTISDLTPSYYTFLSSEERITSANAKSIYLRILSWLSFLLKKKGPKDLYLIWCLSSLMLFPATLSFTMLLAVPWKLTATPPFMGIFHVLFPILTQIPAHPFSRKPTVSNLCKF